MMPRAKDHAHAASAQLVLKFILADRLADASRPALSERKTHGGCELIQIFL